MKTGGVRSLTDDVQHVLFRGFGWGTEKLAACCAASAAMVSRAALSMACELTHMCASISKDSSARMCYCDFFFFLFANMWVRKSEGATCEVASLQSCVWGGSAEVLMVAVSSVRLKLP